MVKSSGEIFPLAAKKMSLKAGGIDFSMLSLNKLMKIACFNRLSPKLIRHVRKEK